MIDLMSVTYTSYALDRNLTWPFVTLPNFEIIAVRARHLVPTNAAIVFAPVVAGAERANWETYAVENQGWTTQAIQYYESHPELNIGDVVNVPHGPPTIPPLVWKFGENNVPTVDNSTGLAVPAWQFAPIGKSPFEVNFNVLSLPYLTHPIMATVERGVATLSNFVTLGQDLISRPSNSPLNILFYPVFQDFDDHKPRKVVGVLGFELFWENFFRQLLPNNADGIIAVLANTCGQVYTFEVSGESARYVGEGDLHDTVFDGMVEEMNLSSIQVPGLTPVGSLGCPIFLRLYPSAKFRSIFTTNKPKIYTCAAASIFLFTAIVFLLYDWLVKRRFRVLKNLAVRSNAIVTSMFPSMVRERLFQNAEIHHGDIPQQRTSMDLLATGFRPARRLSLFAVGFETPKIKLKSFMQASVANAQLTDLPHVHDTLPIADYFSTSTVLFADITGFTAWCSQREPTQVFILLETIYGSFDALAKRHGVFKIETIGDCYMAVTGLPDPQEDHAVIMATFACACMKKMGSLTKKLEASLGPGTAELGVRIGMHSGPVTAGVLRGEKARFQLFGDTVNTASRMESNGQRNRIHLSEETTQLLISAGKGHWITARDDIVIAKGKGELQTFWLFDGVLPPRNPRTGSFDSTEQRDSHYDASVALEQPDDEHTLEISPCGPTEHDDDVRSNEGGSVKRLGPRRLARLVDWNVDVLLGRLRAVVANRQASYRPNNKQLPFLQTQDVGSHLLLPGLSPRDDVVEMITLPSFDASTARRIKNPETVEICPQVVRQLQNYIASIAAMYKNNPFHNFEHASHVTMSSNKLLQRVTSPDDVDYQREDVQEKHRLSAVASDLHQRTYGITSDPLAHFAIVFAALIHDVDHPGLTNRQIVQQQDPMAIQYHNQSVAEQNSITKARDLLMREDFIDLRQCIYSTESEAKRFWQLVVNSVMATDLFDAELRDLRTRRWEKAFRKNKTELVMDENDDDGESRHVHLKATTVIEHIIQASDVVHTMQHWHIYQKWNWKLFEELFLSFQRGLLEKDPSLHWYQGELDFFDHYIIPLAKKLQDCGVFGVSGDEYLNYAKENRKEWALKGEEVVKEMVASLC
jgi:class 3 adenylate cyclase